MEKSVVKRFIWRNVLDFELKTGIHTKYFRDYLSVIENDTYMIKQPVLISISIKMQ